LHTVNGDDLGEATYPDMVRVGEELFFGGGQRFRVLDVVPFEEEDESRFVGLQGAARLCRRYAGSGGQSLLWRAGPFWPQTAAAWSDSRLAP